MKIAVVILNWNGKSLLEKFLPSVVKYSKSADIYVADNASTDDSVSFIKKHYPEIAIIQNNVNGGYAKGYNDALSLVDADVFCLLNSDVEVTQDWLEPIDQTFSSSEKIAIIQPKLLDYKRKSYFEYAGAAGGFIDRLGYPYCRGRVFETLEEDTGQYNDSIDIFWASGACLFIRKSIFEKVNGLDEDFFAHLEEIDLCWRVKQLGYQIKYQGESTVYHLGGATLGNMNPKKTFLNFRNSLYMLVKNVSGNTVWFLVFLRLILDGVASIRFILQGKFSHCLAILKAHVSFYVNFKTFIRKRKKLSQSGKYYSIFSVVWLYFIVKHKHYKNL